MEEQFNGQPRPRNPRRKQRSQFQIFKEAYLPVVIAGIALLLILIFIIGSIVRRVQRSNYEAQVSLDASIAQQEEAERLAQQAQSLMDKASGLAAQFDYAGAIAALETFEGNMADYPDMSQKHEEYTSAQDKLIPWDDPNQVLNLSLQQLIADPVRAFADESYGVSYKNNFITTGEFAKILQQLYENGYILVSLEDITSETGTQTLYLPNGKKPLILTQTNVNYYTYMTDGDGDKLPDKDGDGFASKLKLDDNGNITCELVNSDGSTVTGLYDMVPILESFIETHPDFSYKGARAILAVTGYDGVFGYRTGSAAEESLGTAYRDQEVNDAAQLISNLRELGYKIACYTYGNEPYGEFTAAQVSDELEKWETEVTPVLGDTDIFVFARNSDIGENGIAYSDDKFPLLQSRGYRYFLGFCQDGTPWFSDHGSYIRQGRILVAGANITDHPEWFEGIFDASSVLDTARSSTTENSLNEES